MGIRLREAIVASVGVVSVLCLGTVVVLSLVTWYDTPTTDYGIVFDCGSSHTSLNLFSWPHRIDQTLPLIEPATINPEMVVETQLPLSSFMANPSQAGASLAPLLNTALLSIPANRISSTVVRLGATAGMREVALQNSTAADLIIQSARDFISTYPFNFQPQWAQIISGTQEGVFGWMTVNYLLGILSSGQYPSTTSPNATVMALDMGGASTQITFVPETVPANDSFPLCVYDTCYTLYTHSYLGFGLNMFTASLTQAIGVGAVGNVSMPCWPVGLVKPNPAVKGLWLIGTSDAAGCTAAITPLLNKTACGGSLECGVGGVYQSLIPANMSVSAFSGYVFPIVSMNNAGPVFNLSLSPTLAQLAAAQTVLCALNTTQIQQILKDPFSFSSGYCLSVSYFVALMTQGYNLPLSTTVNFTSTLMGEDVGWAMGGMIMFENLLPVNTTMHEGCPTGCSILDGAGSIAAMTVFAALSLVSGIVLFVLCLSRFRSDDNHEALVTSTRSL